MTQELLISIDLEADGEIPGTDDFSMLSLGACLLEFPEETFYVELKPISGKFNPEALAVSGLDRDALTAHGLDAYQAMQQFEAWVLEMLTKYGRSKAIAVTLSEWDQMFVDWYSVHFLGHRVVNFTGIDMKSYFMGKHRIRSLVRLDVLKLKHYPVTIEHTHNALDDALEQADIFRQMYFD